MPFLKFFPYHFSHSSFTIFPTQQTALHLAARFDMSGSVVRVLVEAGASINALDDLKWSPLYHAAIENPAAVPVLLAANVVKVNLLSKSNWSPLFYAAFNNHSESVIAILKAGSYPHLGKSPLTDFLVSKDIKDLIKSLSN